MNRYIRSTIAIWLVIGALLGWLVVDLLTDWPEHTMISGVVCIALSLPLLDRWIDGRRLPRVVGVGAWLLVRAVVLLARIVVALARGCVLVGRAAWIGLR